MLLNEAIKIRLKNIMKEKNISSNYEVTNKAGLHPSLLTDFLANRTLYPIIDTLYLLCEGLGLTLQEFFNDPIFNIENIQVEKDSK